MKALVKKRVIEPLKGVMQQGLTPPELIVTLVIGVTIATFPVLGVTTILCVLAASVLKLNQVAIQIANYVGYPLQFALFIPLVRLGEMVFDLPPVTINPAEAGALLWEQPLFFMQVYGRAIGSACLVWTAIAVPLIIGLYKLQLKFNAHSS